MIFDLDKKQNTLWWLIIIAFVPRLVAVIFSKGYGMHDDHFLIIEAAQSWVDGDDYNNWLPDNPETDTPTGHSWFYVGLHYFFFHFLEFIGITGPQAKMYVVRFLHALYSLLMIAPVYFVVKKAADKKLAIQAGLLIGLLWFMPIMSVRNLVEMVCIPPVLWATWLLYKEENASIRNTVLAGLLCGLAMAFRFHVILFIGGFGLVFLSKKNVLGGLVFGLSAFAALFITQLGDVFIWGRMFVEFQEYIMYNLSNKTTYFNRPWYQYFGTIGGLMLPPLSLLLIIGYFKSFKKYLLLFLPSFVFFAFHCYFPNKQERFILPVIPFVVLLGLIGWNEIKSNATSTWIFKLDKFSWKFFWVINLIALMVVSPAYSKKSRVEAMQLLGEQEDYKALLVEYSIEYDVTIMPEFYSRQWSNIWYVSKYSEPNYLKDEFSVYADSLKPSHAIFFESADLEARKAHMSEQLEAEFEELAVIEPSYLDKLLHTMNPSNSNETAYIYKMNYPR